MLYNLLNKERLIDDKIDLVFNKSITVSIMRITNVCTTYKDTCIEITIEGDISPNENGVMKRRVFKAVENYNGEKNIYSYDCEYKNISIQTEKITSVSVVKKSSDLKYFNRLS